MRCTRIHPGRSGGASPIFSRGGCRGGRCARRATTRKPFGPGSVAHLALIERGRRWPVWRRKSTACRRRSPVGRTRCPASARPARVEARSAPAGAPVPVVVPETAGVLAAGSLALADRRAGERLRCAGESALDGSSGRPRSPARPRVGSAGAAASRCPGAAGPRLCRRARWRRPPCRRGPSGRCDARSPEPPSAAQSSRRAVDPRCPGRVRRSRWPPGWRPVPP